MVKKREAAPQIKVIAVRDFLVQLLLLFPTLNLLFSQFSEVGKLDLSIPGWNDLYTVMQENIVKNFLETVSLV